MHVKLMPVETVRLDNARLTDLYERLGPQAAEEYIAARMEELAFGLSRLARHYAAGELAGVRAAALDMRTIAEAIGMRIVAAVARDVAGLAKRYDPTALAATVVRLDRVAEASLLSVWDMQDLSG